MSFTGFEPALVDQQFWMKCDTYKIFQRVLARFLSGHLHSTKWKIDFYRGYVILDSPTISK